MSNQFLALSLFGNQDRRNRQNRAGQGRPKGATSKPEKPLAKLDNQLGFYSSGSSQTGLTNFQPQIPHATNAALLPAASHSGTADADDIPWHINRSDSIQHGSDTLRHAMAGVDQVRKLSPGDRRFVLGFLRSHDELYGVDQHVVDAVLNYVQAGEKGIAALRRKGLGTRSESPSAVVVGDKVDFSHFDTAAFTGEAFQYTIDHNLQRVPSRNGLNTKGVSLQSAMRMVERKTGQSIFSMTRSPEEVESEDNGEVRDMKAELDSNPNRQYRNESLWDYMGRVSEALHSFPMSPRQAEK